MLATLRVGEEAKGLYEPCPPIDFARRGESAMGPQARLEVIRTSDSTRTLTAIHPYIHAKQYTQGMETDVQQEKVISYNRTDCIASLQRFLHSAPCFQSEYSSRRRTYAPLCDPIPI